MNKRNLPDRYTDLREEKGISQTERAKELECNKQYISKIENGERGLSLAMLEKYADFFNVSTDYLLGRTDVKSTDTKIQSVCKYTGLNEDNVKMLNSAKEYETIEKDSYHYKFSSLETINLILTYSDYRGTLIYDLRDALNLDLSKDECDLDTEIRKRFPDFYKWFCGEGHILCNHSYRNFLKESVIKQVDRMIQDMLQNNNPTELEKRLVQKHRNELDDFLDTYRQFTDYNINEVKERNNKGLNDN